MGDEHLQTQVAIAIENERPITLRTYVFLKEAEHDLNLIISSILNAFNRPNLIDVVYTSVKELVLNGVKANIKREVFAELKLSFDDIDEYAQGMEEFRKCLNESWVQEYATKAKEKEVYVDVTFSIRKKNILVTVENNNPMSEKEISRVRSQFAESDQFKGIADVYLQNHDNSEGAGMGIILILMLLKGIGIDPSSFKVESDLKSKTVASFEIPLT